MSDYPIQFYVNVDVDEYFENNILLFLNKLTSIIINIVFISVIFICRFFFLISCVDVELHMKMSTC